MHDTETQQFGDQAHTAVHKKFDKKKQIYGNWNK